MKGTMTDYLQDFVNEANKTLGEGSAILIDKNTPVKVEVIPTGIKAFDDITGIGGFPRGRISEIFSKEAAAGKTSLCLHAVVQAQKQGLGVLYVDMEQALSIDRMRELGVDTSKIIISQPENAELAFETIELAIRDGHFKFIVVDSVAALTPKDEIEKDYQDAVIGLQARLMSKSMRKLVSPVSKYGVALVFINQMRANIGVYGYGPKEVNTGGNALKYYASLRVRINYTGQIVDSNKQRIAGKYKFSIVKNKLATPFKEVELEINQYGVDDSAYLIKKLVANGVIERSGRFYKKDGETLAGSEREFVQLLHNKPELREQLLNLL